MRFESHFGHSVFAGQGLFVFLLLTKLDFLEVFTSEDAPPLWQQSLLFIGGPRRWIAQRPLRVADQLLLRGLNPNPSPGVSSNRARVIQGRDGPLPAPDYDDVLVQATGAPRRVLFLDEARNHITPCRVWLSNGSP